MTEYIELKLWEGWRVLHNGEVTECHSPSEVWKLFGWDIENDKKASECATEITREMYCFGYCDLTPLLNGKGHLILEVIPCKEGAKNE